MNDSEKKGSEKAKKVETGWDRARANAKTIGGALLLAAFIRIVLFEPFEIEGPSMMPTLLNGDRVVVAKFMYGLFLPWTDGAIVSWGAPNRGDVVIVKSPSDGVDIVKRVAGLPGDVMEVRDDVVYRNGRAILHHDRGACDYHGEVRPEEDGVDCVLTEERNGAHIYRTSHQEGWPGADAGPTRVPANHVYVLGDHRDRSNDSRFFGPVPIAAIKGRALSIYWSSEDAPRWDRVFKGID